MPVSKKPRSKAALRTSTKTGAAAALPDRRAMESFLAALGGRRGDDALPVGTEFRACYRGRMALKDSDRGPGRGVQNSHRVILQCRRYTPAIRTEGRAPDTDVRSCEYLAGLAGLGFPNARRAVE